MFLAGMITAIVGTVSIFSAIGMEIKTHKDIYHKIMRACPWIIGAGLALMGLAAIL